MLDGPTQHDQLLSLGQSSVAQNIRTIYVVGAHRYQEQHLFNRLFPNVEHIYLFEPLKELAQALMRVEASDPRVRVFPFALSDQSGEQDFYVTNNDGESSSLLRLGAHREIFPHVKEVGITKVQCRRLDQVIQEYRLPMPDLLLLDYAMPGMHGADLASQVLRLFAGLIEQQIAREQLLTQLQQANAELRTQALTDPLTGLLNRRALVQELDRQLASAQRAGHWLLVAAIDLDGFKQVNDRHGHDVGDAVLREMATRLRATVRQCDEVARIGGDEFVLLLPETSENGARELADRIRRAVESRRQ